MSHLTSIKTRIVEREHLLKALKDLGYTFEAGDQVIRDYVGKSRQVDVRVITKRFSYDIGFEKAGDSYVCVADWWGVRGIKRDTFLQQVTQRYAYHATRAKLEEQGFAITEETKEKDGRIHLVLRRAAA